MKCLDIYNCFCAYLLDSDGGLDPDGPKVFEEFSKSHPDLIMCPKCRLCNSRKRQLKLQQAVKLLIQHKFFNVAAPDCLKKRVIIELERADEYRDSGIRVLDLIPWGTHTAQFYNTKDDLAEILVPYMEKGLEQNELCVWVTADISQEEADVALRREIPNLEKYKGKGQLQLFSYSDWYLPGGHFNCRLVLDRAFKKYQEALSNGYSGLRITGNSCWLEPSDWDSFMEYENIVNSFVNSYKMLVVCFYKETEWTRDNIVDVINTHKYVISRIDDSWRLIHR